MRITLLFNPIAGGGHAEKAAEALAEALRAADHRVQPLATRRAESTRWLDEELIGAELLVVVGGDGAVRMASDAAIRTGTPIYQAPLGTENLFAREWGMRRDATTLLAAIERRDFAAIDVAKLDFGAASPETFVLMASVGYDADVVHDLAARRRGGINHLSYVGPMLRALRGFAPQRLSITVDGNRLTDEQTGFVVVANCRQYAMRMNPALRARMDDGRLDAVFFPTSSVSELFTWMLKCEMGLHVRDPRLVYATGREVVIEADGSLRPQIDGDPPWQTTPENTRRMVANVQPAALTVLVAERPVRGRVTTSGARGVGRRVAKAG